MKKGAEERKKNRKRERKGHCLVGLKQLFELVNSDLMRPPV